MLISCSSTSEPEKENQYVTMLKLSQKASDSAIAAVFSDIVKTGQNIQNNNFDEKITREELKSIIIKYPVITVASYVNDKGIMTYTEPSDYKSYEGTDISEQEHQKQMKATNQNAMSGIFKVAENFYAVVLAAPILKNLEMVGSVNPVIKPHEFLAYYTDIYLKDKVDDFWVMETNGNIIYDTDPTQTGRNLFTDSLYLPYPELLAAGHTIIEGDSGKTYYSFLDKTKQKTVYKDVWWRTSSYFGKIWKYSIVKER
jgi:hypothetical protein